MGRITTSELQSRGYARSLSLGSLAGAGSLGLLIPPSIVLIIYGVLAEVSIAKLFIAGVMPGLMIAGFYAFYLASRSMISPEMAPKGDIDPKDAKVSSIIRNLAPVFGLIGIVLGSIYTGWATPSEAAAIGVFAALLFAGFSRQITIPMLKESMANALKTSCMVCSILMCAAFLSSFCSVKMIRIGKIYIKIVTQNRKCLCGTLSVLKSTYHLNGIYRILCHFSVGGPFTSQYTN